MEQYISKDALVAKIGNRIKRLQNLHKENEEKLDSIQKTAILLCIDECKAILSSLSNLEVKEVDLDEEIESYFKGFGKFVSVGIDDCIDIAEHFYELGLKVNNPITAADRGTAEEIIISLKQVEKDYHIDLTREIEWLRNKVQEGE